MKNKSTGSKSLMERISYAINVFKKYDLIENSYINKNRSFGILINDDSEKLYQTLFISAQRRQELLDMITDKMQENVQYKNIAYMLEDLTKELSHQNEVVYVTHMMTLFGCQSMLGSQGVAMDINMEVF